MSEGVISAVIVLGALSATGLVALWRRRRRLREFLDSVAGILSPPYGHAIHRAARAEATGMCRGRPARVRLELAGALATLSVAVDCRASGALSVTRDDDRLVDARSPFTSSARVLMEQYRAVSVSLDARQTGMPLDRLRYRLEIVLDRSTHPDLDPGRIGAVIREATALARVYESGPARLTRS